MGGTLTLALVGVGFLSIGSAQASAAADPGATYIYVSPHGAGSACTHGDPCSVTGAQAKVRKSTKDMKHDIVVQLAGGTYQLSKPLTFGAADSGENGHQVRWQAAPGATPVISGGEKVTGWKQTDPALNIWSAKVPANLNTRQLYVDGVRADLAESTSLPSGSTVTATGYTVPGNSLQSISNPTELEFVYHPLNWVQESCNAASITGTATQTTITMQEPCWDTVQSFYGGTEPANMPEYLANAYSFLSTPGQWYLDRSAHRVYYIPLPGQNMSTANVIAPVLQNLVTGAGTPTNPVHNLTFQGITFAYATWLQPSEGTGFAEVQADLMLTSAAASYNWNPSSFVTPSGGTTWDDTPYGSQAVVMPDAVEFHTARYVSFIGDTFTHLGAAGLGLDQGSQHNTVKGNVMTDISGNGLQVGTVSDPNQSNPGLIDSYNTVTDNYVHGVDAEFLGGVGMFFGYVRNTVISHNEITDQPYSGMSIGWGWGSLDTTPSIDRDNTIKDNYVHDVMQSLSDGGGIYNLGPEPGGVISGNYVTDVVNDSGHIYLDQGSTGWTISQNVLSGGTTWLRANPNSFDPSTNVATDNYIDPATTGAATGTVAISGTTTVADDQLPASIIDDAGLQPAYRYLDPTGYPSGPAPRAPSDPKTTVLNPASVHLAWSEAADPYGVTGYEVSINGKLATVTAARSVTLTGLTPNRVVKLSIQARDASANLSKATTVSVKLPVEVPPTAPGSPSITTPYATTVDMSWAASTDKYGVADYLVYRNGVLAATTSGTSAAVSGATPGQSYEYTVKAEDTAGYLSAASPAVSATTPDLSDLALNVPAEALYIDGSPAALQPGSLASYAVDGDPNQTVYTQATGQYAWQLQIDLGSSQSISSVVTEMPTDKFATEFEIETSEDAQNWTVADTVNGFMGGTSTQNFATPLTARYLRIVAIMPDAGGETGGQMAITQLSVYGS